MNTRKSLTYRYSRRGAHKLKRALTKKAFKCLLIGFLITASIITSWIQVSIFRKPQSSKDIDITNSDLVIDRDLNNKGSAKHELLNASETQLPRDKAFSSLELFISAFPGGFGEMKETFIRTYEFFWPRDNLRITGVLDENLFTNDEERNSLIKNFTSLFSDDVDLNVQFNPLTNRELYGDGWYIQQLIMFWADNFTDAEYVGFVDDDTLTSSAVSPYDLFDDKGRPRVIVQSAEEKQQKWSYTLIWHEAIEKFYKRKTAIHSMTYFPVIVKRKHFAMMRNDLLAKNPEYSNFNDLFSAIIHMEGNSKLVPISQFCFMAAYIYEFHREEYSWHFESGMKIINSTEEMYYPFPRVAIHGAYMFHPNNTEKLEWSRTLEGRKILVTEIMKESYCLSLDSWNNTKRNTDRCGRYFVDTNVNKNGEWFFEFEPSYWLSSNATGVYLAHQERRKNRAEHVWNESEVLHLFGY